MNTYREIGAMIRFHRKLAGLSQAMLADMAQVGKTSVFDIEKGKSSVQLDTLIKVLGTLNIKMRFDGPMVAVWREKQEEERKSQAKTEG